MTWPILAFCAPAVCISDVVNKAGMWGKVQVSNTSPANFCWLLLVKRDEATYGDDELMLNVLRCHLTY